MRHCAIRFLGSLGAAVVGLGCESLIGADFDRPNMVPDAAEKPDQSSPEVGTDGSLPDMSIDALSEIGEASVEGSPAEEMGRPSQDGDASVDGPMEDADSSRHEFSDVADASFEPSQSADSDGADSPSVAEEGSLDADPLDGGDALDGGNALDAAGDVVDARVVQCEAGVARCSIGGRQTCTDSGEWSAPVQCPGDKPNCTSGECTAPPSCSPDLRCGLPGSRKSCCDSISLSAGTVGRRFQQQVLPATVDGFRLDRYEVTVGRFRRFVASYGSYRPVQDQGAHPKIPNSGWQVVWNDDLPPTEPALRSAMACPQIGTWTETAGANEEMPIDCIGWFEAFMFCVWDGGRLPTDAEWSYAASGGDARPYPWGSALPDHSRAVYGCGNLEDDADCGGFRTLPVGSKSPLGDTAWGHADLAGNVFEWVLDGDSMPGQIDLPVPCTNCARLATSAKRLRGGGWWSGAYLMAIANSYVSTLPNRHWDLGFRCARSP